MKSCFLVVGEMIDCCKQKKKSVAAILEPVLRKKTKDIGSLRPEELPRIFRDSLSSKDFSSLRNQIMQMKDYLQSSQVLITNLENNCLSNFFPIRYLYLILMTLKEVIILILCVVFCQAQVKNCEVNPFTTQDAKRHHN
jgi:hypothetical protein